MQEDIKHILERIYPERETWAHKGDFGYVLIVAGSHVYSGSPIFNAMGALRAGADIVVLRGHPRAMDIAAEYDPDIITEPFEGEFSEGDVPSVLGELSRYRALVIGCGLPRTEETFSAVQALVEKCDLPMVLDAEAIRAVAGHTEILNGKKIILTPNTEEFRILTGENLGTHEAERGEAVKKWSKALGVTILLKGHVDVVSDGERVHLNKTGSVYMTKGGFGDVLSGIAGAMLARKADCYDVACAAAYVNGKAGELAAEKFGEGVLASDTFEYIPQAIEAGRA